MAEDQQNQGNTFDASSKAQFPETIKIEPCSSNECPQGHKWPCQMVVQNCPGCGSQILLVRMQCCPVCNEPTKVFRMRTDHTTQAMGIAALCRGQRGPAESNLIEMVREAAEDTVKRWDEETGRLPL